MTPNKPQFFFSFAQFKMCWNKASESAMQKTRRTEQTENSTVVWNEIERTCLRKQAVQRLRKFVPLCAWNAFLCAVLMLNWQCFCVPSVSAESEKTCFSVMVVQQLCKKAQKKVLILRFDPVSSRGNGAVCTAAKKLKHLLSIDHHAWTHVPHNCPRHAGSAFPDFLCLFPSFCLWHKI